MKFKSTAQKTYYKATVIILVRMTIIKKTKEKCWRGCREKEALYTVGGNVIIAIMENSMEGPQNIRKYNYHMSHQSHYFIYVQRK